ncbi:hypothetical protein CEXT_42681 [Caerostris extrusa]|uniref:Uncharacterized protein n=1 Tax=Caerostris extrusa TaxID=172846 RepID=A0AAV4QY37_CAEEX|nr:hypothetical protein CEXT_42681 [Caerostris extrusa]
MPLEAETERGRQRLERSELTALLIRRSLNSNISTDVKENWSGGDRRKGSEKKKIPPFEIDFHPSSYDGIPFTAVRSKLRISVELSLHPPILLFLSE